MVNISNKENAESSSVISNVEVKRMHAAVSPLVQKNVLNHEIR